MWRKRSRNKFNATKMVYKGRTYHSKMEGEYAMQLDWRLKAKDIKDWRPQVTVSLDINDVHIANYIVDFLIIHKDNSKEYIEVKGYMTSLSKLKIKMFEAIYPDRKLTIIRKV